MKKIFKFFPVALAALALASCSSDDLNVASGSEEFVKDPNLLYVTVDNGNVTRSGFKGYRRQSDNRKGSSVIFYEGDQIKLYDNTGDWRPQIWEYNDPATDEINDPASAKTKAYRSPNNTVAVFNLQQKLIAGGTTTRYTNGYGIFPASIGKFVNEERTAIEVDLSMFRQYDYTRVANTTASEAPAGVKDIYDNKGTLPFWGVADAGEMKLNFLTGIGIADLSNVPAPAAGKNNYLIVQSTKKLHDTYASVAFDPAKAVDPDAQVRKDNQPTLVTGDAGAATVLGADFVVKNQDDALEEVAEDIIAIKLDGTEASASKDGQYTEVYFPIVPGAQNVKVYLVKNATTTENGAIEGEKYWTIDAAGAELMADEDYEVEAGGYYAFMNDGFEQLNNVNTPQALANAIMALDAVYDRDFTLDITSTVVVKNGTDKNAYMMDFGSYALKNKVTVTFSGTNGGFKKEEATPSALGNFLTINTPAGENALTIVYKKSPAAGVEDLDQIVIDNAFAGVNSELSTDGKLLSPLVLTTPTPATANLPKILNHSNNYMLTVKAASNEIITSGKMTINAPGCTFAEVIASKGLTEFKLDNGMITKLSAATKVDQKTDVITSDVKVISTGTSGIGEVDWKNIPVYKAGTKQYKNRFSFVSNWNKETVKADGVDIARNGSIANATTDAGDKMIYTVSQLMALQDLNEPATIAADMNLEGAAWTSLNIAAGKAVTGYDKNKDKASAIDKWELAKDWATITAINQPLFGSLSANVSNLKFTASNITAAYEKVGVLAKQIPSSADVTIDNIEFTGTNTIVADGQKFVGGLVGWIGGSAKVTFDNNKIGGTLNLTGNVCLGGLVGYAAANAELKFGSATNKLNKVPADAQSAVNFTLTQTPAIIYDPYYKSVGYYLGSAKSTGVTYLKACVAAADLNKDLTVSGTYQPTGDALYADHGRYGENDGLGRIIYYDVTMGAQTLFGYCGVQDKDAAAQITSIYSGTLWTAQDWGAYSTNANAEGKTYKLYHIAK